MTLDYLIIGAGPAGLQLAAFLERNQAVEEDGCGLWGEGKGEARRLLANLQTRW